MLVLGGCVSRDRGSRMKLLLFCGLRMGSASSAPLGRGWTLQGNNCTCSVPTYKPRSAHLVLSGQYAPGGHFYSRGYRSIVPHTWYLVASMPQVVTFIRGV